MSTTPTKAGIFPRGFSSRTEIRWPLIPAGKLVELVYGDGLTEKNRRPGSIPVYGTNGRCGWHDTALANGPGVILGRKGMGPLGVEWSDRDFWVIDTAYYVRPRTDELDLKYLYYLVKYIGLNHLKDGTSNPSLTRDTFNLLLLPIPPRSVQTRIQEFATQFDDKVELNRRMNETLEAMARRLFKSWFVDFDPVHAKAAVRRQHPNWPNDRVSRAALPKVDPKIAELFPDAFEDSPLGPIPKGWQVEPLDEIAEFLNGLALQKYPAESGGPSLPVIKIAQLRAGSSQSADQCSADVPEPYVVNDGDILFSWSGSLLVRYWCGGKGALNQHLFKVTSARFPKWFCYEWTRYHLPDFQAIAAGKATTMGHIQRGHLTSAQAVTAPDPIVRAADKIIEPIVQRLVHNELESRVLGKTRDRLLPKLLSGDISLSSSY